MIFDLQALRLSNASVAKCGTGKIVNLLSNDVNRYEYFVKYVKSKQYVIFI